MLKVLLMSKRLRDAKKALDEHMKQEAELQTREAAIAQAVEEAATEEEIQAVEEAVETYEADKKAFDEKKGELERAINDLEKEIEEEEKKQETDVPAEEKREESHNMETRKFFNMNSQERDALFARQDIKDWIGEIRSCIREKRALSNVGLTIPEPILGILRQNILEYSKLYKHVTVRRVAGDGREIVMGSIPEAVWTDCCANLNELDLGFNDVELGCWKVGGFFAICNANLEDSDIDLASEVLVALGQAIGRALDKAILYGTGNRMPQGIANRLAEQSQPADYPATAREWVDLHTTNIKTTSATGVALFQALVTNFGAAKGKYSRGQIVHVMNETTYTYIISQAMGVNAAGAIVSGVNGQMPVIGGIIEVLDFVPDYNIISGYFDLYLLGERAGSRFASSEHYKFLSDQTVFKGTARYDGKPAIAEGFVIQALNGQSAASSVSFPQDKANSVEGILISGNATVAVEGTTQLNAITYPGAGTVTWASSATGKATVSSTGLVTGVASGSSTITATCEGRSASVTVTVSA